MFVSVFPIVSSGSCPVTHPLHHKPSTNSRFISLFWLKLNVSVSGFVVRLSVHLHFLASLITSRDACSKKRKEKKIFFGSAHLFVPRFTFSFPQSVVQYVHSFTTSVGWLATDVKKKPVKFCLIRSNVKVTLTRRKWLSTMTVTLVRSVYRLW